MSILRLLFIHRSLLPASRHIWATRVMSTTQLGIGISVALSVVPYLKPFISAYELPTPSSSAYGQRWRHGGGGSGNGNGSGSGWAVKLSALTSRTSKTGTTASQSQILTRSSEGGEEESTGPPLIPLSNSNKPRELSSPRSKTPKLGTPQTVLKPPFMIGRLRPEKTKYSARATATGKKNSDREEGSEDSAGLFIKKGVDFSVRSEVEGDGDGDERTVGEGSLGEKRRGDDGEKGKG